MSQYGHPERQFTAPVQLVTFQFGQDAVAAEQTNTQLPVVAPEEGSTIAGAIVPFDGAIVGLAYKLSAAGSAGSFTIGATIGGTEVAATTQTVGTNADGHAAFDRTVAPVEAGDEIGVEITTDASWDGTTADLAVWVYVLQYLAGVD